MIISCATTRVSAAAGHPIGRRPSERPRPKTSARGRPPRTSDRKSVASDCSATTAKRGFRARSKKTSAGGRRSAAQAARRRPRAVCGYKIADDY